MDTRIGIDEQGPALEHDPGNHREAATERTQLNRTSSGSDQRRSSEGSISTKSLPGSIYKQQLENGRSYASESYFMPNDDAEQTRLAISHQVSLLLLDGQLTMARVPPNVSRILDIGTGPGEWAMAMAEKYPNAEVIATDISIFQPTDVPPNVVFQVDDAEEGWTYTEPFDLIHIRGLSGAFADWPFIYTEAFKHLKQGGILELADCGTVQLREGFTDSYTSIFNGAVQSAAHKAGKLLGLGRLKKSIIESVGFSLMRSTTIEVPLGTWFPDPRKKVVGKMALISVLEGLEAMSLRLLTRETAWKVEDVKDLCAKVQQEILNPETRAFVPVQFVVARKLFDSTGS